LVFKQGPVRRVRARAPRALPPTPEALRRAEAAAEGVGDEALRAALARFGAAALTHGPRKRS
ncbi:MAG TPA: DUF721 domain-containing protein, partial [Beijerinckiaceae bacterium]